jgi:hypothetical protein
MTDVRQWDSQRLGAAIADARPSDEREMSWPERPDSDGSPP